MKVFLAIIAFFAFTGVISATIADASCSQKKSETKEIKYQVNGNLRKAGDKTTITILNYQELEEVVAESSDSTILSVEGPNEEGIITVTALVNESSANVIITAKDAQKIEILFLITNKVQILATIDKDYLWPEESTTLRIQNIKDLKNPNITNDTPDFIQITDIDLDQGTATVTALDVQIIVGHISITADNALATAEIFVGVRLIRTIYAIPDSTSIRVGTSMNITISNIDEFFDSNLQIFSDPTGIVEFGEIDDQGKVLVTGIQVGQTTIKMTADHTHPWSLEFSVIPNSR